MLGRPPYPPEMAAELALHTSNLIGEITGKSGKTHGELEKIFGVGTNAAGKADCPEAGKIWGKWKRGEKNLTIETEQKIKAKALELGYLSPVWILDYIITGDNWCRRNSKLPDAEKIERLMREIVRIIPPAPDLDMAVAHQLGDFLVALYISDCHSCQERLGEPVADAEKAEAAASLEKCRRKSFRQFGQCAGKIEKRLCKIVDIIALWTEDDHVALCRRIGARLQELYATKAA